jgi:quercetin dioxygenase-like cupin family protein
MERCTVIRKNIIGHQCRDESALSVRSVSKQPTQHISAKNPLILSERYLIENTCILSWNSHVANVLASANAAYVSRPSRSCARSFPPDKSLGDHFDRKVVFDAMSASGAMDPGASRHPGMHKTATVDYAIVLSGEIYAVMDEGETRLRAGDTLVQRGTNHAWSNRSETPCLVAFILVSASPV